ncbi:MAG: class I SAM-dependent methyltransferase [Nitrospiraceae bacterium]|nr:MAG: class I SAM-dependent methyltransferase [Nitrospiraceae bacterium]
MKKEEYKIMFNIEDNYWWYVGLRRLVLSSMDGKDKSINLRILDAGCGTGGMSTVLRAYNPYAIDYSEEAISYSKSRNIYNIVRGSVCCMPFNNGFFDVVISLDVLYHINVESDHDTLKEFNRVMKKNGILLLHLPAFNFLKSRHDEAVHTRHRYTANEVKRKVEAAGFKIEKITYRNVFLFPIAVIRRIIEKFSLGSKNQMESESELKPLSSSINRLFSNILFFENKLIASGMSFPFGLSIYCIARKKQ